MELRLSVVQPETLTGADAPKNVDRAVAYIRQAARDGAKLVMLPETYPGPYTVPVNYSPHEALAAVAGEEKVYVVGGAVEYIRPDDVGHAPCYNCLYLYGPGGQRIGKYRRTTPGSTRAGSSGTSSTRKRTSCRCGTRSSASSAS